MQSNEEIIPGFDIEWDNSLKINLSRVDEVPHCLVVYLKGSVDNYNSNFFQKKVNTLISAGYVNLIFNCQQLDYVSSTGIGNFTTFLNVVKPRGGSIVFLMLQSKVFEIFQLLGFAHFFNIKDTLEESIAYFKQAEPSTSMAFPKLFPCPMCQKRLKAVKPGKYRCSECKTILVIDEEGKVTL